VGSLLVRLITVLVFIFLYMPIAVIVLMSFYPGTYQTFPLPGFSLRWYAEFFQDELLIRSLLNSLFLALAASAISAVIGTPCALGLVRYRFPVKRILNTLVLAPMIIPQIIIGISLLILLNAIHLPKGYPYMLIGHVLLSSLYCGDGFSQLYGFQELEAALSLGANPLQTFSKSPSRS
jgi:spermidine/putrescine transport system permease protein